MPRRGRDPFARHRLDRLDRLARRALPLALWACIGAVQAGPAAADGADDETPAAEGPAGEGPAEDAAYDPFAAFGPPPEQTAASAAVPVYRDRIIAPDALPPLPDDDEAALDDGLRRALRVEAIVHRARFGGRETREVGVAFGGFWESPEHGAFSLDALLFRGDAEPDGEQRWRGSATLWQRGLDLRGGWRVDNGLGVLNTPLPALLREQYRFLLPGVPMLGVSSEWRRRDDGLGVYAAAGRGGVYSGARLGGFEPGDGAVASFGAEWRWSPQWSAAASVLATDGRIVPDDRGLPAFQNAATRSLLYAQRWQGARDSVAFHVQASDTERDRAAGLWFDARSARGASVHRYGLFHLEPGLAWGAWPIVNDVRGGYYRIDRQHARWSWSAGADRIVAISGRGFDGWYGTGSLRHQTSARLALGGNLSLRRDRGGEDARALQVFADRRWAAGDTRLQVDLARSDRGGDSWQVQADHALRLREGWRLSLLAGVGALADGERERRRSATLAAYGGVDLGDSFGFDGSLRWTRGEDRLRGLDLGLGWRWRIAPRWSLLGDLTQSRGRGRSPFALDPLTNLPVFEELPRDRSLQLRLRYDFAAGRARPVLGGPPDAAVGRIVGSVFLDENGDGVRGAAERPAADIVLVLDGRFSVRTDAQGRFAFERVAVGSHTLEAVSDNLPLPWSIDPASARRSVRVEVRGDAPIDIPAQRPR